MKFFLAKNQFVHRSQTKVNYCFKTLKTLKNRKTSQKVNINQKLFNLSSKSQYIRKTPKIWIQTLVDQNRFIGNSIFLINFDDLSFKFNFNLYLYNFKKWRTQNSNMVPNGKESPSKSQKRKSSFSKT